MRRAFRSDTRGKSRTIFARCTRAENSSSRGIHRDIVVRGRILPERSLCLVPAEAGAKEQRDHRAQQGVQQSSRRAEAPDIPSGNSRRLSAHFLMLV